MPLLPNAVAKSIRLHELGDITNFYISSGTIKVKITENSGPIAIMHTQGFTKYFLDLLLTSL